MAWNHCLAVRPGHGSYRFCALCWKDKEDKVPAELPENPGSALGGVVNCPGGSPSSMQKHLQRRHGIDVRKGRDSPTNSPSKSSERIDVARSRDFVHDMILRDLLPFSSSSTEGAKQFFLKHCPGVAGKSKVRRLVKEWRTEGGTRVREKVQVACAARCRVTLQADAWGSKGTSRTHYLAILCSWVDVNWQRQCVCIGVVEMRSKKDAPNFLQGMRRPSRMNHKSPPNRAK